MEKTTIKLGISSCLLGHKVRYDGGHKRDRFLTDTLGKYVEYVPVCPETDCGMGVPRETLRLVGSPDAPRLMTTRTKQDRTEQMIRWASERVRTLEHEELCGFIFKKDSPSSGMERVKVYSEKGGMSKTGVGIFARMFMEHFPLLPVEDEGRLHDPKLRENFIERIFVYKRWRELSARKKTRGDLVDYHTRHKLLILSHSQKHYRIMGKLVAEAKGTRINELYEKYENILTEALQLKTTPKKNANVLQHIMGYFKAQLSSDEKQELIEVIDYYRTENIPLIVPVTLLNHYIRKYDQPYLKAQHYLSPHPIELQLRNHV
ncbi:YbgA family protein [Desulfonema magnum]|uniref:DUF523 and DUF1722 n=1 Tax=Desulfonema magnum TaxID=45655 RepID=A0A975BWW9_9BACT|nr:DUF523 and DUF1722 domain-containing protein [Desulfonema magnum]QTA93275.1 DUF523 and DUF1722 [Desulfonema magnum]